MNSRIRRHISTALLSVAALATAGPAAGAESPTSNENQLLTTTRQLIFEGRRSGEGYFSADGRKLVFQSEREPGNPFYQIYLMDLETGDTERVSTGSGKTTCAWIHPDGDKVLFASSHLDPEAVAKQREELEKRATGKASRYSWSFDEHYDIFEADTEGRISRQLTNSLGYDAEGSWSPDGRLIAFASNRQAYERPLTDEEEKILERDKSYFMEIYIMNADGTDVRRLTQQAGYDGGPFFSPDGQRLVWRRFNTKGSKAEVWTMNIDGSDQRQITYLGAMSWAPYYHPSGDYVIFATNKHGYGNFELYMVDTAGKKEPVRVTNTEGFDGLPVFSPDGKRLAWTSSRTADRKAQIFIADWSDAHARELLKQSQTRKPQQDQSSHKGGEPFNLSGTQASISPEDLKLHVNTLASEAMGGRLTGSEGERWATRHVADSFKAIGLEPAGDDETYFQAFEFTAGVELEAGNRLSLQQGGTEEDLVVDEAWRPLAFSRTGKVVASEVVFAGYGIVAPASDEFPAYDAYGDLDVKDKWVMVLRFIPEDIPVAQRQHLINYSEFRHKAMTARDKGARGIIVVSGPNSGVRNQLVKIRVDGAVAGTSIAVISITDATADELLKNTATNIKNLQDALDKGDAGEPFPLPGIRLSADIRIRQEKRLGRNVLARLSAGRESQNPVLLIGAHIDHIGDGLGHNSLASGAEVGKVHHGADDNASGVAALIEIAQYLSDLRSRGKLAVKRDIIFAAWSGEEMGLLGSGHYARTFRHRKAESGDLHDGIAAYLNMDMIGRLRDKVYVQGVGSSTVWPGEIERRNAPVGLPVVTQDDSYLPTDATSFYLKGVPSLSVFTGVHSDYNTPRDTADKLNYEGMARIARFVALLARSIAIGDESPDYIVSAKPTSTASRRNLRAYLGTIPEYGESDVPGVKLNGVAKDGPADKAGLQGGDIIVELAGKQIDNVYDYTYALNAVKVGQPVDIVVMRGSKKLTLSVLPGSRE